MSSMYSRRGSCAAGSAVFTRWRARCAPNQGTRGESSDGECDHSAGRPFTESESLRFPVMLYLYGIPTLTVVGLYDLRAVCWQSSSIRCFLSKSISLSSTLPPLSQALSPGLHWAQRVIPRSEEPDRRGRQETQHPSARQALLTLRAGGEGGEGASERLQCDSGPG